MSQMMRRTPWGWVENRGELKAQTFSISSFIISKLTPIALMTAGPPKMKNDKWKILGRLESATSLLILEIWKP